MEQQISSPTIGAISEALAKAQALIGNAVKDSANPFFKSKYADLAAITEACKKPLSDNNLSFSSSVVSDGSYYLIGTLSHSSGEWLRTYIPLLVKEVDMQKIGAAITYARRFALASLCNVATEDDDGNSTISEEDKPSFAAITDKQKGFLSMLLGKVSDPDYIKKLEEHVKVDNLMNVLPKDFNAVINSLKKKLGME